MTQLLQRAIAELAKLPDDAQDALATRILADLESDRARDQRFEAITEEQWTRLAEMAKREVAAGESIPLEELLRLRMSGLKSSVTKDQILPAHDRSLRGVLSQYVLHMVPPEEWYDVREQAWTEGRED